MLNLQLTELSAVGTEYTQNLPLGAIIGSLFLFELVSILPFTGTISQNGSFSLNTVTSLLPQAELGILNWFNSLFLGVEPTEYNLTNEVHYTFNTMAADTQFASFLQIQSIGYSIYTVGALWLIVASVILLLAMVGPITLSMNKNPQSFTTSPFTYKKDSFYMNSFLYFSKQSQVQMASVGELQILPSRVQFPLDSFDCRLIKIVVYSELSNKSLFLCI